MIKKFIFLLLLVFVTQPNALVFDIENEKTLNNTINHQIKDTFVFSGLAVYLNQLSYYVVDNTVKQIDPTNTEVITLNQNQWLAIVGRFNVLAIQANQASVSFVGEKLTLKLNGARPITHLLQKNQLDTINPELDQIRYQHLWYPFAQLAKLSETTMVFIKQALSTNWGVAILLFAVVVKLLLLPISILTVKYQRKVSEVSTKLEPILKKIKATHDGEEAHIRLMQAHKHLGVSPFYTLKPLMSTLIQIPVLIAVFNALGEMPQFNGVPFLWFNDLAYPDNLVNLPFTIPLLGDSLNLMPFLMLIVTVISTILFTNSKATNLEVTKQKRNLYLMGVVFFVLFYPFPSAMVMYWMFATLLQIIQQRFIRI